MNYLTNMFSIQESSWVFGLLTTLSVYYFLGITKKSPKRGFKSHSTLRILLSDIRFDRFFIRKITSFIYFLTLVIFYSTLWEITTFVVMSGVEYGFVPDIEDILVGVGIILLLVMGVRVILETMVSLVKISENSSMIGELLVKMNESNSNKSDGEDNHNQQNNDTTLS